MIGTGATLKPAKAVLLTGAGFSKPFGGYLSADMWALIFRQPEIRASPTLREALLKDLNFERVYDQVMMSPASTDSEKDALGEAIWRAYNQMHNEMQDEQHSAPRYALIQRFVSCFRPSAATERGFVFTLNQDRLVETTYLGQVPIDLPGVPPEINSPIVTLPDTDHVCQIGIKFSTDEGPHSLAYIKLHGSVNWRKSDGARGLVIGTDKTRLLAGEPLLKWYHDLFHAVLHAGDRSLLVVGYSFRDPHINATIVSAAKDAGLKLFVLAPSTPEDFKTRLSGVHSHSAADLIPGGEKIWQSLYAYYSGSITNYYMSNNAKLPAPGRALFDDLGLKSWPLS